MQAIGVLSKSRRLARVLINPSPSLFDSAERVNSSQQGLAIENADSLPLSRRFHSAALLSANIHRSCSQIELNHKREFIQFASSSMVMPTRLFSSEAQEIGNDTADAETAKTVYDKMLNCIKLSNLRIHDDFNSALCREVTKACVRAGAIDFGMKTLWKHNLFGLTPDIGSAHHLLSYANQHNDVKLMVKVLKLMKKNDLPFQPGTADIVLRTLVFLMLNPYGRLKWRSEAMKKHSLSTGFSCAKGFLLEHKPESAAAIIQVLYQILPEARRPTVMVELQKLVSEWPLEVIKQQKEDGKAFTAALQNDISALINALPSLGVEANVSMQDLTGKEAVLS
ncbi:hypothetical protein Sango_2454100 [Sesamum angolense]|uniref:Uncharacterized protein n=1 Tax=Sesamum angolense TaxID=2727404 RepID=A0AAE2BK91_9LAMI|nr:hypothetical protein Sango_2454100 [Sesamum angolense]